MLGDEARLKARGYHWNIMLEAAAEVEDEAGGWRLWQEHYVGIWYWCMRQG